MTREVKLKVNAQTLDVMTKGLGSLHIPGTTDFERVVSSIQTGLHKSFQKKLIDNKKSYTISLKLHEAITLRHLLMRGGYPFASFEENELRIVINDIDCQI